MTAAALLAGALGTGSASAQSIDDLRARAQSIAAELDQLNQQGDQLEQEYLSTGEQLTEVQGQIEENKAAVADSKTRMEQATQQAGSYMVNAYMGAGSGTEFSGVGSEDPNQAVNEKVLLETLQGGRQQVADDLRGAKLELEEKSQELDAANKQLEQIRAQQADIMQQMNASIARQKRLLDGANADLQNAIRAEQERRQREAEARARAALEAAARQAAAQQAAAQAAAQQAQQSRPGTGSVAARAASGRAAAPVAQRAAASSVPYAGGNAAIQAALAKLGTPYRWGGTGNGGYDCSGLTQMAFAAAGKSLPRTAGQQYSATQRVTDPQPGDLIFWGGANASHVAIYMGNGQMVAAPRTGDVVKVQPVYGNPTYGRVG
ncbi:MAG: NlpC/P60 family protein [Microthrixaceae bacterium]